MSLGIYVQIPFCQTKCTYCNFHAGPASPTLYSPYSAAIVREISEHQRFYKAAGMSFGEISSELVDTIYIGGGTPSLLDPAEVKRIIAAVMNSFPHELKEVTLEADPETITAEKSKAWHAAGVNRISMGAQSFHDNELIAAGRMHRRADIFDAMNCLRGAGFTNITLDLIAGLPHQTESSWRQSLDEILQIKPEHISVYMLEIDEGSRLGKEILSSGSRYGAANVPSEDAMADFYEIACKGLSPAGYEHYEISNWALPGFRSLHNSKYWRREPYLGFGAGAHSFDGNRRWANAHDPAKYVAAIQNGALPVEQREEITESQALDEEMFLGLRQLDGINLNDIERRYKKLLEPQIAPLLDRGLLELNGPLLRLSPRSLTVSNEIFAALLN